MSEQTTALQKRQPLNIDMSQGVTISNYDEAMQMAALVHNSGLAPKSLDTVQKVAVAMLMAVEMGLPVITGLQNIAVINGKAGVWGDAVLSLVRNSGMMEPGYPKEREEGTPFTDGWTFFCTVKRKGGQEVTGSFSWAEAKRAGFDNPQLRSGGKDPYSPWTRFPRRMMQWKARQWVYRDEFGDVLRGMRLAEELHDIIDMEPSPSGDYSMPEPRQEPEAQVEGAPDFEGLLPENLDREQVEQYAKTCAEHFGQTVDEFKGAIVQNDQMQDFLNAFSKWQGKKEADTEKQFKNELSTHSDTTPQNHTETPKNQTTEADPWQSFRQEFINLRQAGFSTWTWKNKARLEAAPEAIQAEARDKWVKLYPGNRWPLDPPEAQAGQDAENETASMFSDGQTSETKTIGCPERDGEDVPVENCGGCDLRDMCPSWEVEGNEV
ncbi:MAG: hypothetical protein ACLFUL_13180 [Desulfobacteraceae bacterium]